MELSQFIGRFHPVLVHLPIGILILAVLFVWLERLKRIKISDEVIRFTFGLGAIVAVLSCITGILLAREGDYDGSAVTWHRWMGISTAFVSILLWRIRGSLLKWTSTAMLVMLIVTGHLGASLTHGSDYLTVPLMQSKKNFNLNAISHDSAKMYAAVIEPILEQHCYQCHGDGKQKGRLRLDAPNFILAGGKNGKVIEPGSPQESELMERLRLPVGDEHHMPPKEKAQPDQVKLELIARWIESGASFDSPLRATLNLQEWMSLLSGDQNTVVDDIPDDEVEAPEEIVVSDLQALGVSVSNVSQESNYLQLNFIGVRDSLEQALVKMGGVAPNVVWLKLGNTILHDNMMVLLKDLRKVTRLGLERTSITDAGLVHLKNFESLAVLNLGGTQISLEGLRSISGLRNLRSINLYQTQIRPDLLGQIESLFPNAAIEFGEYQVPLLATDTIVIK